MQGVMHHQERHVAYNVMFVLKKKILNTGTGVEFPTNKTP